MCYARLFLLLPLAPHRLRRHHRRQDRGRCRHFAGQSGLEGRRLATTSQSEADEKRGRELRKAEEAAGKRQRQWEKPAAKAEKRACPPAFRPTAATSAWLRRRARHFEQKSAYNNAWSSNPATLGLLLSISSHSLGAWAPPPRPTPKWPAAMLSGAPVNITPGQLPARRGNRVCSIPAARRSPTRP